MSYHKPEVGDANVYGNFSVDIPNQLWHLRSCLQWFGILRLDVSVGILGLKQLQPNAIFALDVENGRGVREYIPMRMLLLSCLSSVSCFGGGTAPASDGSARSSSCCQGNYAIYH